ncbi:MAG TPA: hypothetical protein VL832_01410 [Puia sp.]|nr:hypothetical protein [Puia sp.]
MKSVEVRTTGNMTNIRLYDIFRKDLHLPDEKAHEMVQTINETVKGGLEENLQGLTTKEFVKGEIMATREFIKDEILATRGFVKDEILATREFVKDEIHRVELKVEQTKSDLTKAIFWTSLIQFLAIIGSVIGIISFMFRK